MNAVTAEFARLADDLRRLADFLPAAEVERRDTLSLVQSLIQVRRHRDRIWPASLFGEPAWDMMLDLYVAWLKNSRVSVSSLCIASASPTTTALRYIAALEREGIVTRTSDEVDRRRQFIELSPSARAKMNDVLRAMF